MVRTLIFGDSITQGYWGIEGGWVERLRRYYDAANLKDYKFSKPSVFNLGISANNSEDIVNRIEQEVLSRTESNRKPIVIVQIGANDSSVDNLPVAESVSLPIEEYEQNLRAIVKLAIPLSSKLIFVGLSACDEALTTPVNWGDFYYRNKKIKEYEDKMRDIAKELEVPFIAVFDHFKKALEDGESLLEDGLHPNDKGHALIAEIVLKELENILAA